VQASQHGQEHDEEDAVQQSCGWRCLCSFIKVLRMLAVPGWLKVRERNASSGRAQTIAKEG
jgi:hypothetical protein